MTSAISLLAFFNVDATEASASPAPQGHKIFDDYFRQPLSGFLKHASPGFATCDYPGGTKLKSCCTPTGKTYVSVARMVPAMAEWSLARGDKKVREVLLQIYQNAFDPNHPDFWGLAPSNKATQKTVESAMMAYSLWRLGDNFIKQLSPQQRTNINTWIASCTQVPERQTNHAWFTALNQAARMQLSSNWPEFRGDEKWMLDDLKALDALYIPNNDGWYSDWTEFRIYDYYNFWTFANFPLYWIRLIGEKYPQWAEKFRGRAKLFLEKTPYFFGSNGAHPLFGRSLIYRFALLSPMLLGYEQKLWPHSPGMLRRVVRKSFEFHWNIGAFDSQSGKLRETYSRDGTPDVKENYVDNGHPYWCMQVFSMLALPKDDPFWTHPEEPLPVERDNFSVKFPGPKMLLRGSKTTGEVRWIQSITSPRRETYRDRYIKFASSSHFPYCTIPAKNRIPLDQVLIFRDRDGNIAARERVIDGQLLDDGIRSTWIATLGQLKFEVISTIRLAGEFEFRSHEIVIPPGAKEIEVLEGSYALANGKSQSIDGGIIVQSKSGTVAGFPLRGHERGDVQKLTGANIIHRDVAIAILSGTLASKFESLFFASRQLISIDDVSARKATILNQLR